jgi:hypothetical protein
MVHISRNIFIFLLSSIIFSKSFGQYPKKFKRPNYFHVDKSISHSIKLPLQISQKIEGYSEERYKASFVDLGMGSHKGILVQGDDGANATGFWIFIKQNNSWNLILQERGLDLDIKPLSKNGFRKIEVVSCWISGCRFKEYQFNGKQYTPCLCYDAKANDKGIKKFKCPQSYKGPWPTVAR